jgi:hypothetical protein
VIEGGINEFTVRVALLLVTLPALLLTITAKREALSACVVAGVAYDALVAPTMFAPFFIHWHFNGVVPVATTLKVAVCPAVAVLLAGCVLIVGGISEGVGVTVGVGVPAAVGVGVALGVGVGVALGVAVGVGVGVSLGVGVAVGVAVSAMNSAARPSEESPIEWAMLGTNSHVSIGCCACAKT